MAGVASCARGDGAVILLEILRGVYETIRETLPSDEREGAVFLAAMAWSFVLFWAAVLIVSWLSCSRAGNC